MLAQSFVERTILVGVERGHIAIKDVVGLLRAIGCLERGLHLEGMSEDTENGSRQLLFGLSLVITWDIRTDDRDNCSERLDGVMSEQLPLRALRQRDV